MQTLTCEKVLLDLSKIENSDWEGSVRRICRDDALALKVERVSVWLYSPNRDGIRCECLYRTSKDDFEKGLFLQAADYPTYFKALDENLTVAAHDAQRDPRTREFTDGYLTPLGITSMLDVPVRLDGRIIGVVCHEHVGAARRWSTSEVEFATMIANYVSLSHAASRLKTALAEIDRLTSDGGKSSGQAKSEKKSRARSSV